MYNIILSIYSTFFICQFVYMIISYKTFKMLDLSKKNGYEHLETILSLTFFDKT